MREMKLQCYQCACNCSLQVATMRSAVKFW